MQTRRLMLKWFGAQRFSICGGLHFPPYCARAPPAGRAVDMVTAQILSVLVRRGGCPFPRLCCATRRPISPSHHLTAPPSHHPTIPPSQCSVQPHIYQQQWCSPKAINSSKAKSMFIYWWKEIAPTLSKKYLDSQTVTDECCAMIGM